MRLSIRFDVIHYPGYGSPPSWTIRVIYQNKLLEENRRITSEWQLGAVETKLRAKWDRNWDKAAFAKALKRKPLASQLCDHCGRDTLDGAISCVNKVFCKRCDRDGIIEQYKAAYAKRQKDESDKTDWLESKRRDAASKDAQRGFHWRDGYFFLRMPDCSVRLTKFDRHGVREQFTVPPNEWASIVCSVSAGGEDRARWDAAQDFHGRPKGAGEKP